MQTIIVLNCIESEPHNEGNEIQYTVLSYAE